MKFSLVKKQLVAMLLIFLTLLFASCGKKDNLIAEGVKIAGIDAGKMTEEEAASALTKYNDFAKDMILTFDCGGTRFEIPATQLGIKPDVEKTVQKAYLIGRGEDKKQNSEEIKKARTSGLDITLSLKMDTDKLILAAGDYLGDKIIDSSPMTVEYGEDCLIITNSREGKVIDVEKAAEAIEKELSDLKADKDIKISVKKHKPKNLTFKQFKEKYVRTAKDAVYTKDGESHHIEPEVIGVEIDEEEAKKIFEKNKNNTESYEIPAKITKPEITASYLEEKYVNKVIAKYSTSFAGSAEGRCINIALAASKIDGYVLNPGERFSYNKVVGPRTAEAGFKNAHVYVGTKVVDGIGGGICQVSSTLYNAVVLADLKTVSRTNHSIPVSYVPLGRDATVSYGSIDYVFENNKSYPVSIKAKIDGTTLTVSVVGTSEVDYSVEFVSAFVNSIPYATVQTEDATVPVGETKVITAGSNGSVYDSYRVYKKNGKEYDRKFESKSRYQPVTAEVAVGVMAETDEGAIIPGTETPSADVPTGEVPSGNAFGTTVPEDDQTQTPPEGEAPVTETPVSDLPEENINSEIVHTETTDVTE